MARRLGRVVVTCLITASLVGATGASASAERWWSGDRSGDVGQIAFSPEPPPCGTVTESVTPRMRLPTSSGCRCGTSAAPST